MQQMQTCQSPRDKPPFVAPAAKACLQDAFLECSAARRVQVSCGTSRSRGNSTREPRRNDGLSHTRDAAPHRGPAQYSHRRPRFAYESWDPDVLTCSCGSADCRIQAAQRSKQHDQDPASQNDTSAAASQLHLGGATDIVPVDVKLLPPFTLADPCDQASTLIGQPCRALWRFTCCPRLLEHSIPRRIPPPRPLGRRSSWRCRRTTRRQPPSLQCSGDSTCHVCASYVQFMFLPRPPAVNLQMHMPLKAPVAV